MKNIQITTKASVEVGLERQPLPRDVRLLKFWRQSLEKEVLT